jgi:hypothetical protein
LGLGGIGLAWQAIAHSEGKEMRERLGLPDFGQLVMTKFVEQAAEQILNWPKMRVEETPIDEAPARDPGYLLTFQVGYIIVRSDQSSNESRKLLLCLAQMVRLKETEVLWSSLFFQNTASLEGLTGQNSRQL